MQIYKVGGAVRDHLLGIPPKDIDYVVVGSTPTEMEFLGFVQVGSTFPVFLKDGEEYALARTERKSGVGYKGFDVEYNSSVTLEEDLFRRDLTINSMAMTDNGSIIDPYGGIEDINNKILRHTSEAFADDPVRVLRTARFAARYADFSIHPKTIGLMQQIAHEIAHVPTERVWAEIEKGLKEPGWYKMFDCLKQAGVFEVVPVLSGFRNYDWWLKSRDTADLLKLSSIERFAVVAKGIDKDMFTNLSVPLAYSKFSIMFNMTYDRIQQYGELHPTDKVILFEQLKIFNDPSIAMSILSLNMVDCTDITMDIAAVMSVDVSHIASLHKTGQEIKQAILTARTLAIS